MHRFFADESTPDELIITDRDDVKHLQKVIRIRIDEEVELVYHGKLYRGNLKQVSQVAIFHNLKLMEEASSQTKITLVQGMPKGSKLSEILMHGTESSVDEFIICQMDRSIAQVDPQKQARYDRIVKDASKQSKRLVIPTVRFATLSEIDFSAFDRVYFFYEDSKEPLRVASPDETISIVIGPEGGFSDREVEFLKGLPNVVEASLGKLIFRTETAGLVASAILRHEMENK